MISTVNMVYEGTLFDGVQKLYRFVNGYGASEYSGVIPVNKTYDIYEQREIVEKIIRDEFYKCKAEKEGI